MLPPRHRLRLRGDFDRVVRSGRRAGRPRLVVHLLTPEGDERAPRAGFVVGRAVGGAVRRNEVRRRLRHIVATRLDRLPAGAMLVIRAQPAAAGRPSAELARDVDRALGRLGIARDAA